MKLNYKKENLKLRTNVLNVQNYILFSVCFKHLGTKM